MILWTVALYIRMEFKTQKSCSCTCHPPRATHSAHRNRACGRQTGWFHVRRGAQWPLACTAWRQTAWGVSEEPSPRSCCWSRRGTPSFWRWHPLADNTGGQHRSNCKAAAQKHSWETPEWAKAWKYLPGLQRWQQQGRQPQASFCPRKPVEEISNHHAELERIIIP